ncbi:MAG: Xaa-Pro peptidase family protein [Bacillota bacterium]
MIERLRRLQEKIQEHALEAVLITQPFNRQYLSGFDGTNGVLLVGWEQAFLITDFRYREQAAQQAPHCEIRGWQDELPQSLAPILAETGWQQVGFEQKQVTYALFQDLSKVLTVELVPTENLVEEMRMIKDQGELAVLRRGASCLDQAFTHILNCLKPGLTEQAVALELEIYLRRLGASAAAFEYIIASGERGALPHGSASAKALARGELVTMDFGAVFDGYATDMTRTVCLGEPDGRQRQVYEIVRRAQDEAVRRIRPGMTGREADAPARTIIEESGFGEQFGHGLGHGVGLETHEQPTLSPRGEIVLSPGMIVTVEPGVYIPGWGGVRIEDMVLITGEGTERLTLCSRDLITVA